MATFKIKFKLLFPTFVYSSVGCTENSPLVKPLLAVTQCGIKLNIVQIVMMSLFSRLSQNSTYYYLLHSNPALERLLQNKIFPIVNYLYHPNHIIQ